MWLQLFLLYVPSFRLREKWSEFVKALKTLTVKKTHFNKQSFLSFQIIGKEYLGKDLISLGGYNAKNKTTE